MMQEVKFPLFEKGRILKIEMLENMRDYPRDALAAYGETLSDGIVWGFTPSVEKEWITFSKGVTRYRGQFYVMHEPFQLEYGQTDVESAIRLEFGVVQKEPDFSVVSVSVKWEEGVEIRENQQELVRFKLKKGAYLRKDYQDLYDFTTEYNTINVVHVQCAGLGEPTLPAAVLHFFAGEALQANPSNPLDINFCLMCLNSSRIERKAIIYYIAGRLKEQPENWSNGQIHQKLVVLLNQIKREGGAVKRSLAQGNKILVD